MGIKEWCIYFCFFPESSWKLRNKRVKQETEGVTYIEVTADSYGKKKRKTRLTVKNG